MAKSGGQPGNANATKGKRWSDAIDRALAERSRVSQIQSLDALAEVLLKNCDAGDMAALKELGDRLDGRASQAITGADGGPVQIEEVRRTIIDP